MRGRTVGMRVLGLMLLLVGTGTAVSAQGAQWAVSRPSAAALRAILDHYGRTKVEGARLNDRPVCIEGRRRAACQSHLPASLSAVRAVLGTSGSKPRLEIAFGPVRDSAGGKFVDLFLTFEQVEQGMDGVELREFQLDSTGTRVVGARRVLNELVASRRRE